MSMGIKGAVIMALGLIITIIFVISSLGGYLSGGQETVLIWVGVGVMWWGIEVIAHARQDGGVSNHQITQEGGMKAEFLLIVGLIVVLGAVEAVSVTRIVITAVIGLSVMGRGVWLIHNPARRRIFRG